MTNNKGKSDPRHNARKLALANIFCHMFDSENSFYAEESLKKLYNIHELDDELYKFISKGVISNLPSVDDIIGTCAPDWTVEKIAKIDLVILRIAVFELIIAKNVPVKVAIDEAVELAKEFGGESSSKFVNGVLGTVVEKFLSECGSS